MYRLCLECNSGRSLRLAPGVMACPEQHDELACVLEVGDVLGDFQIEAVLPAGDGGYAKVYRARPLQPGYPPQLALKVAQTGRRKALEQESAALTALQNGGPGQINRIVDTTSGIAYINPVQSAGPSQILQIYPISPAHQAPASGSMPGRTNPYLGRAVVDMEPFYYLALEFMPGRTLRAMIDKRRGKGLSVAEALNITRQVGRTLQKVHAHGLIHLDVKPTNIMFNEQGEAVLIDYGITVHESGTETSWPGTAPYAPREQINQDYPDHRADIHALGVTTFEMLTGILPYRGESANALATSILTSKPFTLAQVEQSLAYLDPVLERALAPEPGERYASVQEFLQAIDEVSAHPSKGVRRVRKTASPPVAIDADDFVEQKVAKPAGRGLVIALGLLGVAIVGALGWAIVAGGSTGKSNVLVTSTSAITSTAIARTTPVPTVRIGLMQALNIVSPKSGEVVPAQDDPRIELRWEDPNKEPLGSGEAYAVKIERKGCTEASGASNCSNVYQAKSNVVVADRSLLKQPGTFDWQVWRATSEGSNLTYNSYDSGTGSFTWSLVPTATPTSTAIPTAANTPTAAATATRTPRPLVVKPTPRPPVVVPATRPPIVKPPPTRPPVVKPKPPPTPCLTCEPGVIIKPNPQPTPCLTCEPGVIIDP